MSTLLLTLLYIVGNRSSKNMCNCVLLLTLLFSGFFVANCDKEIIYDSADKSQLLWTTNSPNTEEGWLEESFTNVREGSNMRSYVTCELEKENVDNWVRMPYLERKGAKRLSIEVHFTIRDCKHYPRQARTCKETFTLYAYESDVDFANKKEPQWIDGSFKRMDRLTADAGRFSGRDNVLINVETRSVPVTKNGIYFAFRDEGACVSILHVKVYHEVCPETVKNFAWFPYTFGGPEQNSIESTSGRCVENATPPSGIQPQYVCKADGSWALLSGGCQCNPGYKGDDGRRCTECEIGTYKENPGFGQCQLCPAHSSAQNKAARECICDAGFYRASNDAKSSPCTTPPSRPENPKIVSFDESSVSINWNQPSNLGGRSNLWYRVECRDCPRNATFYPSQTRFTSPNVSISRLEPDTTYTVYIYAENDVTSQVDGLSMHEVVNVHTKPMSHSRVTNFKIDAISQTQVTLSWDPPINFEPALLHSESLGGATIARLDARQMYQLCYRQLGSNNVDRGHRDGCKNAVKDHRVTIDGLAENMDYEFKVRPFTSNGHGAWSEKKIVSTHSSGEGLSNDDSGSSSTAIFFALLILFLVIGVFICVFMKRRSLCIQRYKNRFGSDISEYKTNDTSIVTPDSNSIGTIKFSHAFNHPPRIAPYVDPTTYEDPNQALTDFTNEINTFDVTIDHIIGSGEFGQVCRGRLRLKSGSEIIVAYKMLKEGVSEKAKKDFLVEAMIMGQFDHPNVIKLMGVITKTEPVMIVTEFMENGSLDSYLRACDIKPSQVELVRMLGGIAKGMEYLSCKTFVHRDLAARNILVDRNRVCKIADFGLSRLLGSSEEKIYTTQGGKIPIRWTAPEAILYRTFTTKSDVWSFGVLTWEVMSYGERPYGDWPNQKVMQEVQNGFRLMRPSGCPYFVYSLMQKCWQVEKEKRPDFAEIVKWFAGPNENPVLWEIDDYSECNFTLDQQLQQSSPYNFQNQQQQHSQHPYRSLAATLHRQQQQSQQKPLYVASPQQRYGSTPMVYPSTSSTSTGNYSTVSAQPLPPVEAEYCRSLSIDQLLRSFNYDQRLVAALSDVLGAYPAGTMDARQCVCQLTHQHLTAGGYDAREALRVWHHLLAVCGLKLPPVNAAAAPEHPPPPAPVQRPPMTPMPAYHRPNDGFAV